jgi:hypothetical protein
MIPGDQAAFEGRPGFVRGGPNDGLANGLLYRVISAGPTSVNPYFPGRMVGFINKDTDLPGINVVHRQISSVNPLPYSNVCAAVAPDDTELINWLVDYSSSYSGAADYEYPSNFYSTGTLSAGSYNSNSYISGILSRMGATLGLPDANNRYPGWNRPLLESFFSTPTAR